MKDPPALRLAGNPRQHALRVIILHLALCWELSVYRLNLSFGQLDEVRIIITPFSGGKTKVQTDFARCPRVPRLAARGSHTWPCLISLIFMIFYCILHPWDWLPSPALLCPLLVMDPFLTTVVHLFRNASFSICLVMLLVFLLDLFCFCQIVSGTTPKAVRFKII